MTTKRIQTIEKIFNKTTSSKQIHEGILFVENTNGDFSYSKGYGGNDIDSPLLMASITKLFTTTCILALLEKGELSLEDKLSNYFDNAVLSSIHVYGGKEYSFDLTISDLLFQVSGLPDVFEEGKDSAKSRAIEEDYYTTFSEQMVLVKNLKPHFAPRTKRKAYYADINFDMLGEIIEKATNTTLAEAYKKYIFEPLALESTYLPEHENDFIPNIYYKDKSIYRPKVIRSSRASGGCITTARELMIFIKAFFGGELFNKVIFEKLTSFNKLQASMGPIYYGSGYMRIPLDGLITLFMGKGELMGHSGSTGSFAFYYPVKDLFMVGDLNQMGNAALPIRLSMKLAMTTK
ncbi:serine hydrolase domain-containing protein [Paenibacillus sp.]|uniref:serine hydrolase domain-containing protein n=1 Tax=Paenibacillus sp. TaxID=58172 RepID=UPI0028AEB0B6|nr:serine hydrolase domain-containing protein [Paenibacillus sp.]